MWSSLEFLNSDWLPFVIPGAILLLLIFIWKEWKTTSGSRLFIMIGLGFICICSLALLALKPAVPHLLSGKAIILTNNFQQSKLDSLLNVYPDIERHNYETGDFPEIETSNEIFILGDGIKPYDFHNLKPENNPVFIPGKTANGIIQLKYNEEVTLGDSLKIKGRFKKPVAGNRLVLEDFSDNSKDSIEFLKADDSQDFKFMTKANIAGNYLYNLVLKDSSYQILSSAVLPVSVKDRSALKILILNSYPLFETKYLKGFLGSEASEVSLKTRISRGRYKYEFINTETRSIGNLSLELLQNFDLLIIDSDYLKLLNANQLNAIKKSVNSDGLGVFIQPVEDYFRSNRRLAEFNFITDQNQVRLNLEASGKIEKYNYRFEPLEATIPIIENEGNIYSAYKMFGLGKIGSSVFKNSYQLVLNGDMEIYEYVWSRVINTLSGEESIPAEWKIEHFPVYKDEPVKFTLRTNKSKPDVATAEDLSVPLAMHPEISNLWSGEIYPSKAGWNQLKFANDSLSAKEIYVFEENSWKALESFQIREANMKHFSKSNEKNKAYESLKPVNRIWFFISFLISALFLWLIPKLE